MLETAAVLSDVAALVLIGAGGIKLVDPAVWVGALIGMQPRLVTVRSSLLAVARVVGVVEIVIGAAALLTAHVATSLMLAGAYGLFAIVSSYAMRSEQSCGCFGAQSSQVTSTHVGANVVAAVAATVAMSADSLTMRTDNRPVLLVIYLVVIALSAAAIVAMAGVGSTVATLTRPSGAHPPRTRFRAGRQVSR